MNRHGTGALPFGEFSKKIQMDKTICPFRASYIVKGGRWNVYVDTDTKRFGEREYTSAGDDSDDLGSDIAFVVAEAIGGEITGE